MNLLFFTRDSTVSDNMTEEILCRHEKEVERMKEYYRQNQDMLEKVARRQLLWAEFLDLEASCRLLSAGFRDL